MTRSDDTMSNELFPATWWARKPANGRSAAVILTLELIAIGLNVYGLVAHIYPGGLATILEWAVMVLLAIDAARLIGGFAAARRGPRS
jgi:hypothetical protein